MREEKLLRELAKDNDLKALFFIGCGLMGVLLVIDIVKRVGA